MNIVYNLTCSELDSEQRQKERALNDHSLPNNINLHKPGNVDNDNY